MRQFVPARRMGVFIVLGVCVTKSFAQAPTPLDERVSSYLQNAAAHRAKIVAERTGRAPKIPVPPAASSDWHTATFPNRDAPRIPDLTSLLTYRKGSRPNQAERRRRPIRLWDGWVSFADEDAARAFYQSNGNVGRPPLYFNSSRNLWLLDNRPDGKRDRYRYAPAGYTLQP